MEDEGILRTARWLAADYGVRKEPEVFLPASPDSATVAR